MESSYSSVATNTVLGSSLAEGAAAAEREPAVWHRPPSASRNLLSIAERARSLMHLQAQIEEDAEAR